MIYQVSQVHSQFLLNLYITQTIKQVANGFILNLSH
jgi:hypothetical protein